MDQPEKKAWVVAVDMGYGHQRTAYPLRSIAMGARIINANNYDGIPEKDRKFWNTARSFYEFVSRFRRIPIVGLALFLFLDSFQRIVGYYPKRDLSTPNISGSQIMKFIMRGWGQDLIGRLAKTPLPFVTTFFTPAFMAEHGNYPNDIYCIICDADISRTWVATEPEKSRIIYFAPCTWARDRLKLYGVSKGRIVLTGYPLPKENIGGPNCEIAKRDLRHRLLNLDPRKNYRKLYSPLIKKYLGELPDFCDHPLTLMFSIGGAGAQKEIAVEIINSLKEEIKARKLRFIISLGTKKELAPYIALRIKDLDLDGWVNVILADSISEYFEKFNRALRTTDILLTKPSELSFYAGLGIPIIIQPSIGSQEDFNRRWLMHIGCATLQENPAHAKEWIFDLLQSGDFAEMAMQGFLEIEKMGTYNIEKFISKK